MKATPADQWEADRLVLTAAEKASPLWQRLSAHFTKQLTVARKQNDIPQTETSTAEIRGRIAAYKSVLALNSEPPDMQYQREMSDVQRLANHMGFNA